MGGCRALDTPARKANLTRMVVQMIGAAGEQRRLRTSWSTMGTSTAAGRSGPDGMPSSTGESNPLSSAKRWRSQSAENRGGISDGFHEFRPSVTLTQLERGPSRRISMRLRKLMPRSANGISSPGMHDTVDVAQGHITHADRIQHDPPGPAVPLAVCIMRVRPW